MEDRRIVKTRKALFNAVMTLCTTTSFDSLSITDICNAAHISRITFYSHYNDKYLLADDLFNDLSKQATDEYRTLQKNNAEGDPVKAYMNFLDAVMKIYEKNALFYKYVTPSKNPYLFHCFYRLLFNRIHRLVEFNGVNLRPNFDKTKFASFLCSGLWSYLSESVKMGSDIKATKEEMKRMLSGIIDSPVFYTKQ